MSGSESKFEAITLAVHGILQCTEDNPNREGLEDTPIRFARAWLNEWMSGYGGDPALVLKAFEDGAQNYDQIVLMRDIPIYSHCEHHLAPFWGRAHIAYMPDKKIVGLSKLVRLSEIFAQRLQVQERLTRQIADALVDHLQCHGAGVVLECRHMCMESRGARVPGTATVTSAMLGTFRDSSTLKAELMGLVAQRPL